MPIDIGCSFSWTTVASLSRSPQLSRIGQQMPFESTLGELRAHGNILKHITPGNLLVKSFVAARKLYMYLLSKSKQEVNNNITKKDLVLMAQHKLINDKTYGFR